MSVQRPEYTRPVVDVAEAVRKYRANETQLRRLGSSRPVRNVGATSRAIEHREHQRSVIEASLMFGGHLALVGHLTEERKLTDRIAYADRHGQSRSDLVIRRRIQRLEIARLIPKGAR